MTSDRTTSCPVCNPDAVAAQPGQARYCTIGCYRTAHRLDHPDTGDGRTWCQHCRRYTHQRAHAADCPSTTHKETTTTFTPTTG